MRMLRHAALLPLLLPPVAAAQQRDSAAARPIAAPPLKSGPPIRKISSASALSTEPLGTITGVIQLKDGRVLLNDGQRRRLLLLDTALKVVGVLLDSLSESSNFYGTRAGGLLPYRGDTSFFVDPAALAMITITPGGTLGRVRSVPRVSDASLLSGQGGMPGADARGRIIYRVSADAAPPRVAPPPGVPWIPQPPDSAFVVGIDLDTRRLDTLGVVRVPKVEFNIKVSPNGGFNFINVVNPLPATDEWAVLADGTVAFVRGRDYRVEYRQPDGAITSSQKLPYDWQRLLEEDKQRIADSVLTVQKRQAMSGYISQLIRWVNQYRNEYPKDLEIPKEFSVPQGLQRDWKLPPGLSFPASYIFACAPGEEPTMLPLKAATASSGAAVSASPPATGSVVLPAGAPGPLEGRPSCIPSPVSVSGGVSPPMPQLRTNGVMAVRELPDYRPPFWSGAVRADADGNLWVRINTPAPIPGGPVYDIINRQGELVDRLQVPPGHTPVGFGAGRVVYLATRDAKGVHLARVRLR